MKDVPEIILPRFAALIQAQLLGLLGASALHFGITFVGIMLSIVVPQILGALALFAILSLSGSAELSELTLLTVILPTFTVTMILSLGFTLGVLPAINGSIYRAFEAAEAGADLPWTAPIHDPRVHLTEAIGTQVLVFIGTFLGALLLVIPGILFAVATTFALPAAALDGLSPTDAIRRALTHFGANPLAYLGLMLGSMMIAILGSLIPVVGAGISAVLQIAWIYTAYRHWFPAEA